MRKKYMYFKRFLLKGAIIKKHVETHCSSYMFSNLVTHWNLLGISFKNTDA